MDAQSLIRCRDVGKVFRAYRRKAGLRGIVTNFVHREVEQFVALRGIDLDVRAGELVGLIGSNGAGKTTLVKCLTGIIPVTSGSATLFGRDCFDLEAEHKRALSLVMGQRSQLWWDIPAMDSFRLLREIYEIDGAAFTRRVGEYAERLEVSDKLGIQLRQLSLGERMKMEIIGAFVNDPQVVFLDEPTIGLDLVSQETIRQFLRELNEQRGATIVLTSHDMADIEQTCRRLLILDKGSLLFDGDLVDLRRRLFARRAIEVHLEPGSRGWTDDLEPEIARHGATLVRHAALVLSFDVPVASSNAFLQHLFDLFEIRDLAVERQPLEQLVREVFRTSEMGDAGA